MPVPYIGMASWLCFLIVQRKESDDKGKNPLDRPCFLWYNVHKNDLKELMTHEMSLLRIPGKQGGGFPPF